MKASARKRDLWIQASIVLLLLALTVAAFVRSSTKPLSADDLKISVSDLRSFSSDGALICEQYLEGHLTETFFNNEVQLLQDKVKSSRESLETTKVEPEISSELDRTHAMAQRLESAYNQLADQSRNVGHIEKEMNDLVSPLKSIEEGLKLKAQNK
jgi:hypothetical protein